MRLVSVGIADFRNIEELFNEFHERLNIFCGKNGEGKSNLLEAIHFISTLQTMRSVNKRSDLIRFGQSESKIKGHFFLNSPLKIDVEIHEKGKKARIENKAIKDVSTIASKIGVVCFVPSDLEIVRGGPKERRRALDKFCFQMDPNFIKAARDFEKILKSRNQILKQNQVDEMQLSIYTKQFIEAAAKIVDYRLKTIQAWQPKFEEAVAKISENVLHASMSYHFKDLEPEMVNEDYAECLKAALQKKNMLEKMRGRTLVGPHTDDLNLFLDKRPARHFASQGETRALVLALKIAEVRLLAENRGEAPILLLDDVCGELDHDRVQALFNAANEVCSQIFVTTPHEDDLPPDWQGKVFQLKAGSIVHSYFKE